MSYFDNDYLDVPSYEFLQRYPKVYPILCLILRPTVSISGQIINVVILSDLMLRLSQKLQKQCLEAMLKCESRFMGRTWRDTIYDKPFYIAEPENQSNAKFTSYRLYTKRGMIEDCRRASGWTHLVQNLRG